MKRLFNHLLQIVFWGILFFLMIKLPLLKIPYIQEILTGVIVFLLLIFMGLSYKKRKFCWGIIFFLFLFVGGIANAIGPGISGRYKANYDPTVKPNINLMDKLNSGDYCGAAEDYDKRIFEAKQKNWEGDVPCLNDTIEKVRTKLNKLKNAPPVFIRQDKLTATQKQSYHSFREDSHWSEWVNQNYASLASGTDSAEDLACAAKLESLCSEYDRRHPDPKAITVTDIMKADAKNSGCWPCEMAYIILTVVQDLSSVLESKMQNAALNILKILFLLWILYATFLAVVFPSKGATFIKDLMTRLLCVITAALILSSGDNLKDLYRSGLSPIIGLALGLTQEVNKAIKVDNAFGQEIYSQAGISSWTDYCSESDSTGTGNNYFLKMLPELNYRNSDVYKKNIGSQESLITPELQVHLLCMTQNMYRQVSPITAVGQSLIGFSLTENRMKILSAITRFLGDFSVPNLAMWSVGIVLVVLFTIFSFMVAFKIIDIFLRLGFVLVLMPLFVATWAFPVTRDFTKKGFMFLMSIITEFLGLALAINFIMVLFETGIAVNKEELIIKMMAPYSKDYGENLYNVVVSNGGWIFLFMMIALAFMGFQLLIICTKVISSFFGTKAIGGDMTGIVAMSAVQMAGKLGKKTWDVGSYAAKNAEPYKAPQNLANPSGQNTPAASKRYLGQQTGEGVKYASRTLAAGVDKLGVGVGQALSKTGIGAIVGVPLTLGAKTLSIGIRAVGKVGSGAIKVTGRTTGAVAQGIRHPVQTTKNGWNATKTGAKNVWDKTTSGPKKVWSEVKRGFSKGDKK